MKKVIFLVWILTLAACSGKKTAPVSEIEDQDLSDIHLTELYDIDDDDDYYDDNSAEEEEWYDRYNYSTEPLIVSSYVSVTASSELSDSTGTYSAGNLIDHTCRSWAVRGGSGESFTLDFERYFRHYSYYRQIPVTGFALKNGYGHLDYYSKNNRVKSFKIYVDGEYLETIQVKDSISFEQYYFEEPVAGFKTIQFVIDDIYKGTTYNDTCVAEIAFLLYNFSDRIFYDNILLWLSETRDGYYHSNSGELFSISDSDGISLFNYLPFDFPVFESFGQLFSLPKTKIARLDVPPSLQLNNNLPRLDGATAMYPLYSSFVRAVYPEGITQITIDGEYGGYQSYFDYLYQWDYCPSTRSLVERFGDYPTPYGIEFGSIVQCNRTAQAFERLINGEVDIIFCYEPSQDEINAAAGRGLQFHMTPIAKDAFVFIVNEKNILNNITRRQIRDIYSGRVTNWKTISGIDEPVIAYQRPANSGSQTTLQSIMGNTRLARPLFEGEYISGEMGGSVIKVASNYYNYNSAIGYSFLYYLTNMIDASGVKILSIDGVMPTRQTIQNGRYPFTQTVYAITTGNESDNTRRFITWILSAQGQELVAKTGYTPVR